MARRVLFVASIGATLRLFVAPIARSLRAEGIESIAAAGNLEGELAGFDRTYELPSFRRGSAVAVLRAYRCLRAIAVSETPDLLHLHTPPALVLGRLAARSLGIPSVAVAHGSFLEPWGARSVLYATLESTLCRLSAATITENDEDARFYKRFARAGTVAVAPVGGIGIDLKRVEAAKIQPLSQGSSPSIVVVGRLTKEKNLDLIVRAFQEVRANRPNAGLTFVGSPLPGDAAWRVPNEAGISHTPWAEDPYPIIAGADLLVLASRREGFSMAAAEALLLGVPVVAVNNRGVRQLIRHHVRGLSVVGNNSSEMATAIEHALRLASKVEQDERLGASWSTEAAVGFHRSVVLRTISTSVGLESHK